MVAAKVGSPREDFPLNYFEKFTLLLVQHIERSRAPCCLFQTTITFGHGLIDTHTMQRNTRREQTCRNECIVSGHVYAIQGHQQSQQTVRQEAAATRPSLKKFPYALGASMSCGRTQASNSSGVTTFRATAASLSVVPSLWAFLAAAAALSYPIYISNPP